MRIKKESLVLPLKANDLNGEKVDIESFKGQPVFLSFFRDITCLFCNLRVHKMINWLETNTFSELQVITLFSSPKEKINKFTGRQEPTFIVIPDPGIEIYHQFGLESSLKGKLIALLRFRKMLQSIAAGVFSIRSLPRRNTLPADFLIGPDQKIHTAYYGKDFGDHIPLADVEGWLQGL